jgi:MtN3 and saliva related transmembrane protein
MQPIVAKLAPIINSVQFFPQLYKIYKTKKVTDLSFYSLFLMVITNVLWLSHGYYINDYSLIYSSIFNLFVGIILIILYKKYSQKKTTKLFKNKFFY